jgi:hypothetical protein
MLREQCPHCRSSVLFTTDTCPACGKGSVASERLILPASTASTASTVQQAAPPSLVLIYFYAFWILVAICLFIGLPRMDRFYFYLWMWPLWIAFVVFWAVVIKFHETMRVTALAVIAWLTLGVLPTTLFYTRCYDLPKLPAGNTIPERAIISRTKNGDGTETVYYRRGIKTMDDFAGGFVLVAGTFPFWGSMIMAFAVPLVAVERLITKKPRNEARPS